MAAASTAGSVRRDPLEVVVLQLDTWSSRGEENFAEARRALRSLEQRRPADLVVLPELVGADLDHESYLREVRDCAHASGAWVVGGSHHHEGATAVVNRGAVVDRDGSVVAVYEKQYPYDLEARSGVVPGTELAAFELGAATVLVLLCADLWHSELLHRSPRADVIAVPAFSITRWQPTMHARRLWRHMAISRAYEFGSYVAISDWSDDATYGGLPGSGAAGIASPAPRGGERAFVHSRRRPAVAHALDIQRLHDIRQDRRHRRFLDYSAPSPARGSCEAVATTRLEPR